jgi:hypothetical protein
MRYLLPLIFLSGCFHAGAPLRSAQLPDDGAWRIGLTVTLPGWSAEHGMSTRAGVAPMMIVPLPVALIGLLNLEVGHTIGQSELIAHLGMNALGGEVRHQLSDGPDATSLEFATLWKPVAKSHHPHFRLGMSGNADRLLYGAHVSYGPEPHSKLIKWGKYLEADSPLELRVTGVLGGYFAPEDGPLIGLGAAPYLSWNTEEASTQIGGGAHPMFSIDLASARAGE